MSWWASLRAKFLGGRSSSVADEVIRLATQGLQERGIAYELNREDYLIECEAGTLSLVNLIQECSRRRRGEWKGLVNEFLSQLLEAKQMQEEVAKLLPDWERVKDHVTITLFESSALSPEVRDSCCHWEDIPGFLSMLSVELPSSRTSVHPMYVDGWPVAREEVYHTALENTRRIVQLQQKRVPAAVGHEFLFLFDEAETPLLATCLINLESYCPDMIGSLGSLLVVPTKEVIVGLGINEKVTHYDVVTSLAAIALDRYSKGPRSLSRAVWYRSTDGAYSPVPWKVEGETFSCELPPAINGIARD